MHSSEVKEDTHDSFRRITAEVICAGENELRVRVAAPSLFGCLLYTFSEPTRRTPISYAVFCLKKKKKKQRPQLQQQ